MFDRITWNLKHMNGQPCVRGMRLTVRRVVAGPKRGGLRGRRSPRGCPTQMRWKPRRISRVA